MKFDAVIFDLDGTLWNTAETVARAWNQALREQKIEYPEITVEQIGKLMGLPHNEILDKFLVGLDRPTRERAMAEGYKVEEAVLSEGGGEIYPGVQTGLAELQKKYPLFLVSNCQTGYLDAFFRWSKLKTYFCDWECHGNTRKSKAENLVLVRERNQLQSPVYVGDTLKDQISAKEAGISYIHCNYGFGKPEGECVTVDSFGELTSLLLKD